MWVVLWLVEDLDRQNPSESHSILCGSIGEAMQLVRKILEKDCKASGNVDHIIADAFDTQGFLIDLCNVSRSIKVRKWNDI